MESRERRNSIIRGEWFEFIYLNINKLSGLENKKGDNFSTISHEVLNAVKLSNSFFKDLEKISSFYKRYNHLLAINSNVRLI